MSTGVRHVTVATTFTVVATLVTAVPGDGPAPPRGSFVTVPVVVAARDIPEGVLIDRMSLVVARWPVGTPPADAYAAVDSAANRVSRVAIHKGEPIVPGRLAPEGAGAGLEARITPGKRAYGIRVNDVASLAGMVQPNSRVDIMVVIDHPENPGKRVARLFMPNMRVLAIGPTPELTPGAQPNSAVAAWIEVSPKEAERLAIAAGQGSLQLVLRGYGDPDSVTTSGATYSDVVKAFRDGRETGVARPETATARILRGSKRAP